MNTALDGHRTLANDLRDHLVANVCSASLVTEPFDHLHLEPVFPPDFYPEMMANLPSTRYYGELNHRDARLPNGTSARRKLELRPAQLQRLPEPQRRLWSAVTAALTAPELEAAYRERFASALEQRFKVPPGRLQVHAAAMLLRDLGGYNISVHCDSFRKAITTQYYLPENESQLHLGTSFHNKNIDGTFAEAKTLEFAPNSGYAFPVVADSWHSVRQMKQADGERNSLMLIYYVDQGWLGENINRAKRFAEDMRYVLMRPN